MWSPLSPAGQRFYPTSVSVMSIESDSERGLRATASPASRCEAKRVELQRLRERLDKVKAGEDDEDALLLAAPMATTDPLSCLCLCGFKKLGQSYILHEQQVVVNGVVETRMLLVGPHWIGVLVTLGIILVSTGMFLTQQYQDMPWYYVAVTFGLCGMTLYYLFLTTCTDPGIVRPKQKDLEVGETEVSELDVTSSQEDAAQLLAVPAPRRHPTARRRYCDICGIEQDRYTDHCEDCGVCVEGYDHHCPWMGKCIGRGNMHAFKMFNVSWVVYVCFVLFVAITSVDWGHATVQTIQTLHRTATGSWVTGPDQN